ncbi:MAG: hypothetical protein EHM35_13025 [Planctomycetaceae bacterium]|nr:MAG: hypothetical protein EHM35_13025 [Planctomycetaceae bacterium]
MQSENNNTPQSETIAVPAAGTVRWYGKGRWMLVESCSAASFMYAFDNDPLTAGTAFKTYPCKAGFNSIRFFDSLGAGFTVSIIVADEVPADNRYGADELTAIAASLAAIDADTSNLDVPISDVVTELQDIEADIEAGTTVVSTDGDCGQIALTVSGGATPRGAGPDVASRVVEFWTAGTAVYWRIDAGLGNADATHYLLPSDLPQTIPIDNPNKLRFFNNDGANAVVIYWAWRN